MSFRIKITIIITVLVALIFSAGSTILIHRTYMTSLNREEKESIDNISMVTSIIRISYENSKSKGENQLVRILKRLGTYKTSSDVFLVYKDDELIYGNSRKQEELKFDMSRLPANFNDSNDIYVTYINGNEGMEYIVSSFNMVVNDDTYVFCVFRDVRDITKIRDRLRTMYRNIFVVLLSVTALVSYIMSSFIVLPLSRLTRATSKIAEGDLSTRTNIRSDDEIGELSATFDRMTEKLEENVTRLEESAEEKDRFMGAFTHELKTPMTSIIGYAELLRTQELEEEDREDALNYIYSEAKRLENMALKLLQIFVSDKEEISLKVCNPGEIVEDIVTHLTPTLNEQNIKIICRTTDGTARLEPDLVRTLIINLIDNARKAMDIKGRIRVDQKFTDEEDGVIFIITDNGKGMPPEAIKHITEAFYRVDKARSRQQGGAGLGLALVKKIVELHHGNIEFTSEPGVGTVVTVTLRGGKVDE